MSTSVSTSKLHAPSQHREILPFDGGHRCFVPEAYAWEVWQESERLRAVLERIATTVMTGAWYRAWAKQALGLSQACKGWVEDPSNPGLCINCDDGVEGHRNG